MKRNIIFLHNEGIAAFIFGFADRSNHLSLLFGVGTRNPESMCKLVLHHPTTAER